MLMNNNEYIEIIETIKGEIRGAQYKAALSVNRELIMLYYHIGTVINEHSLNVLNAILREREYSIAHRARSCAATEIVDLEPLPDSTAGFRRYRTTADHKAPCVQGPAVLHVDTASLRQTQQTIVPGHIARGATCCRFVAAAYPRVFFAIFVRVTPGRCPTGRVVEI